MRSYILRIIGAALLSSLAGTLLPRGNVRRYVLPFLSLGVMAAVFLPALTFSFDPEYLLPASALSAENSYESAVTDAYREKIEAELMRRAPVQAEVTVGENYTVEKIHLTGDVTTALMLYITTELGVSRSHVEIG